MKIAALLASVAVILIQSATTAFAAESKRPNILVIVADDLGYGELGAQGNREIPTPHIDSLAKNGIRFTNGYVTGPYCSPTRAALLTGRYQQRFGHEFNSGPVVAAADNFGLPLTEKTIGDRLKAAGYATGWFGKSHMGFKPEYHPQKRGFDEFYGFLGAAHPYLQNGKGRNAILDGTTPASDIDHTTEAFARRAVAFIEKHHNEPWLVYLPFNAVHAPLESTPRYLERFNQIADPKRRSFAAMLSALDDGVGSVLAKLSELKGEEDTLIFFFSDNGGPTRQTTSSNGPLRGFKATTWEGGIRIPWIVQWKGHLPAGKVDDRPVVQMDILPTALAAAGVEIQPDWKLDGVNLLPFLTGANTERPHDIIYWRFGQQLAIRKGDWKLVKAPGAGLDAAEPRAGATTEGAQLFDLSKDIGEKNNLAASQPEKVKELAAAWQEWNSQLIDPKWIPGKAKAPAKKKRPRTAQSQSPSSPSPPSSPSSQLVPGPIGE
jgi:arylsulfatase A-like enzyme